MPPPVLIVIPLYRNATLIEKLVDALIRSAMDVRAICGKIMFVNDSPDDLDLVVTLERHVPCLRKYCHVDLFTNDQNRGFVRSVNAALELALTSKHDVLLLNSDAIPFPGSLVEIRDVAYLDYMIGFVSPRSNNATICSLPHQAKYRNLPPDQAYENFHILSHRLPRITYAPTAVGFCLYIKHNILVEFGIFDEIYDRGYNEENDLIMRANRCGFRAALANRAFVYHAGAQSFGLGGDQHSREIRNRAILDNRFPEYSESIERYFSSPRYSAELLLAGLIPNDKNKLRIAFDCTHFGCYYSGTFEAAKQIVSRAAQSWEHHFEITLICSLDVFVFHEFDRVRNLRRSDAEEASTYAAVVRIGQPFEWNSVFELGRRAAVVILFMLDTIALDCAYLDTQDLESLWQFAISQADAIIYNSNFTQQQYRARFHIPDAVDNVTSFHSTKIEEYLPDAQRTTSSGRHILVIGNHYRHKFVAQTVDRLLTSTIETPIVVLGMQLEKSERLTSYPAGALDPKHVEQLYRDATAVIFPSHYEGFGFPILHALAHHKPVLVRRVPVFEEVQAHLGGNPNLHIVDSTDELVRVLASMKTGWIDNPNTLNQANGWNQSCNEIKNTIDRALERADYDKIATRLSTISLLEASSKPFSSGLMKNAGLKAAGLMAYYPPMLRMVARIRRRWRGRGLAKSAARKMANVMAHVCPPLARIVAKVRHRWRERAEIRLIVSSGLFDREWYLQHHPDVREARMDPTLHYLRHGVEERRDPSPYFDSKYYLKQNPDVADAGLNPLIHYLQYGAMEGRAARRLVEAGRQIGRSVSETEQTRA